MSNTNTNIAVELSRIIAGKTKIKEKLISLGLATSTEDSLSILADIIWDITDQGAVSLEVVEGYSTTIPRGWHNGGGTVIALSNTEGDALAYRRQTKSGITPLKQEQTITPDDGYYGLESVQIDPIPDIYQDVSGINVAPEYVLANIMFVTSTGAKIPGTMTNWGNVSLTLDETTLTYTIPRGFHEGSGKINIVLEAKTVTPTKSVQDIVPDKGKLLSKVTVAPIPDEYHTSEDADAVAEHILDGETAYVKGVKVKGEMPNNGAIAMTIDGITKTSVDIPLGYTSGGTVSLTDDIEKALASI